MTTPNDYNIAAIREFRENSGKLGGRFEGTPVLLLTTKGAKTGKTRINPLVYLPDDGRMFVFASKAGAPTSPDWYHNLVVNPDVTLEVGTETFPARATVVSAKERDEIYAKQASKYPGFADYEKKTTRKIPVVELVRAQ